MSASFDAYKIFYYAGKYKNITHAASALFLSQSTVSRTLQSLEFELGCRLFERTQHGVDFTEEGALLYKEVAPACESIIRGESEILKRRQNSRGTLRIGASDFSFSRFVLPTLRRFLEENPSLNFSVVSDGFLTAENVFDSLLSGRIEVACTAAATLEKRAGSALEIVPAASYTDIVVASAAFHELRNGCYALEELAAYPFASLILEPTGESYLGRLFQERGQNVRPRYTADSVHMFLEIVQSCPCVAVAPELFREELSQSGGVFEVNLSHPLKDHNVNILTLKGAGQNPLREAFCKQLRQYIRAHVPKNVRNQT